MHSRQSRMLVLPQAWRSRNGPDKDEPDVLFREVERLSTRKNADRVVQESASEYGPELIRDFIETVFTDKCKDVCKRMSEITDEALRREIRKLKGEAGGAVSIDKGC